MRGGGGRLAEQAASRYSLLVGNSTVRITLLGHFRVWRDAHEVGPGAFGGRQARVLLRVLAVDRGAVVTRDAMIEALWGEATPADPAAALNVLVNRARRALGDPGLIETVTSGYLLRGGDAVEVDVERFLASVHDAGRHWDRGDPPAALRTAERALTAWTGEPLPEDGYADWAQPHVTGARRGVGDRGAGRAGHRPPAPRRGAGRRGRRPEPAA